MHADDRFLHNIEGNFRVTERCKANPCCGEHYGNCKVPLPQDRSGLWFHNTDEYRDNYAVDCFAADMKAKLAKKRAEGRGGWDRKGECTAEFLSLLLREHVEKGDPLDVGNLAMMLHQRGERIIIDDETASMSRALNAPRWQPIDTAPRDGTDILLSSENWHGDVTIGGWHFGGWRERAHPSAPEYVPTIWHPIPATPTTKGSSHE